MRLWAEVWTAAGVMTGIINLAAAVVTRKLDAAGQVKITPSPGDFNAAELLAVGRYVRVYALDRNGLAVQVERGYLQKRSLNVSSGGRSAEWSGTDGLHDLQRYSTLRGRVYDNEPIADVVRDLIRLAPASQVEVADGLDVLNTTQRFDGVSVLQALTRVAEYHGLHVRSGTAEGRVEFGPMGAETSVRITNLRRYERTTGVETVYISHLNMTQDGTKVVNWIEPVSGPADGALTLRYSTRVEPYVIQTTTNQQGRNVYYLEDTDSQALYGVEQQVVSPDSLIVPVAADAQSAVNASDVLYDWAATWLRRNAMPKRAYSIDGVHVEQTLRPGDLVYVDYDGDVYQVHGPSGERRLVRDERIEAWMWVVEATERYNLQGKTVDLELSTTDVLPENAAELIARAVLARERDKVAVKITVPQRTTNATLTLDVGVSDDVVFEVSDEAVLVTTCYVTLTRADTTTSPDFLLVDLDGVRVAGGPFLWGEAAGVTVTLEISDMLVAGAMPLRGEHTLTVEATGGTLPGDVEVKIRLYEVIAGLAESGI